MSEKKAKTITNAFQRLSDGDRTAARPLYERFYPRLLRIAARTLGIQQPAASEAEDTVQSAFISFYKRAEDGRISGELDRNDLWRLLGTITKRKALKHLRRERAQKRGRATTMLESSIPTSGDQEVRLDEIAVDVSGEQFDLLLEEMLELLTDELQSVATLRLMGYKNRESADALGLSESQVERRLAEIRQAWTAYLSSN